MVGLKESSWQVFLEKQYGNIADQKTPNTKGKTFYIPIAVLTPKENLGGTRIPKKEGKLECLAAEQRRKKASLF